MYDQMPTWLGVALALAATGTAVWLHARDGGWRRFTVWLGFREAE